MSVNAIQAQGTKVYIATGSGGAKNITGIALGNPTIITSAAHGFVNGDVVTLAAIGGTTVLNGLTLVVKNKTTNTFAVDVDTTGGVAYTSGGTATPVAWTQIKEVKAFKPSGATNSKIDVTDLDSTAKEYMAGLSDNGTGSIEFNALPSDAGQAAVQAAFSSSLVKAFKVTYPSGATPNRTFSAIVTKFSNLNDAAVDGVVTGSADLQISGAITVS